MTVAEADALTPVALAPIVANPNTFSGVVAKFTDSNVNSLASDFTATIDWGDGTTSPGTVSDRAGAITVSQAHVYATAGQFPVTVALAEDAPEASGYIPGDLRFVADGQTPAATSPSPTSHPR